MRILCIFGYPSPVVQFWARILPLFERLAYREHTLTILTLDQDIILEKRISRIISRPRASYFRLFLRAKNELSKGWDVLYTIKADLPSLLISFPLARIYHVPLMVDTDDYETSPSLLRAFLKQVAMKFLLRKCDYLIVASRELYNFARKMRFGSLAYIPNSTDLEKFNPRSCNRKPLNRKVTVVWSGILYPFARWNFFLQALAYTKSDFNLLVIGGGPSINEFIHTAKRFKVWDKIIMTGHVPHSKIPALLAGCDVALLPLLNNLYDRCKCPIKLFEYMAIELPIVCTDVGEPAYIVQKTGCGLITPPEPKEFAKAIDCVVRDIDYWKIQGRRGRRYLELFQNWDILSLKLESSLYKCLAQVVRK